MTAVVVVGVAGSGKSTIASRLATRLGWRYLDADDHHPPANIAKMRAGVPLTDEDRRPWLARLARLLGEPRDTVLACSALRRSYRDLLRAGRPGVRLVYLAADREVIVERLSHRTGHYFPADLLDSQYATLEEPAPDEGVLTVPADDPPDAIVDRITAWLRIPAPRPPHLGW